MFLAAGTVFAGGMGLGALGLRRVGELQAQTEEADEPAVPLPTKVQQLLASEEWQKLSGTKYADVVRKLELIEKVGAPAMRVLSSKALASYGAIPPFSATLTVDAKGALQDRGVVMFVSHRWLRSASGEPDDDARTKFKALVAFAHYYEHFYCRQAGARNIYFWIDYACIDQDNMLPGVQSLPLYVAASNDLLVYETKDYADRAWCCAEMVLAYCFMYAGRMPWIISGALGASNRFDRFARYGDRRVLQTPLGRGVSNEADRPHVAALLELAEASCAWTGGEPRPLVFGETAVEAQLVLPPAPPKGKEGNRRAPSAAGSEPPSGGCRQS